MRTAKTLCAIAAVCAVLIAGLVIGAQQDATVAFALRELWLRAAQQHAAGEISPWYLWGCLAEALGSLPAYAGLLLLGWSLCCGEGRHLWSRSRLRSLPRFLVGAALLLAGGIACACVALHYLARRELYHTGVFVRILLGIALALAVLLWSMLSRRSARQRHAAQRLGAVWCVFSLVQCGVIQLMKALWQRTRFDDLLAVGDAFAENTLYTPWTQLPGSGGSSFPSGHTGAAGTLLVMVFACLLFDVLKDDEPGWLFVGCGFAAAVGFGRMLIGRHYLSDVCMALLIDCLLLAALLIVYPFWQKWRTGHPAPPKHRK